MAQSVDVCIPFIKDAVGEDLSAEEIQVLRNTLNQRMKRLRAENAAMGDPELSQMAATEVAEQLKVAAAIERRNTAMMYMRRLEVVEHVKANFDGRYQDGMEAILVGRNELGSGNRYSVAAIQNGIEAEYVGGLLADLEKIGLTKPFAKGTMDLEVTRALWQMGRDDADFTGIPSEARKIAEVLHKYNEMARINANENGAWIGKLAGYAQRQGHDMSKIRKAGFQKWKDEIYSRLDAGRTFKDSPDHDAFLQEVYDGLVSGVHRKADTVEGDRQPGGFRGPGNLAKSLSEGRVLHFKDADAWFEYNQMFGTGNLREATFAGLERMARATGLMKVLGPNPESNFTAMTDALIDAAKRDGVGKHAQKLRESRDNGPLRWFMNAVTGADKIAANEMGAKIGSNTRAIQSMSKLGGSWFTSWADVGFYASEMKYQGRGFGSSMAEAVAGATKGRDADRMRIASTLGVFFDSMRGEVGGRFSAHDDLGGKMSRLMNAYFKLNLLGPWTERLRVSAALAMSHNLALNSSTKWGSLDPKLQRIMKQFGIDDGKWALMQKFNMDQADGRQYLTPEGARDLTDADIDAYLTSKELKTSPARRKAVRRELEDQLRAYFSDRAEYAVLEPGARELAWQRRGTLPGTYLGETLRFFWQFKAFPMAVLARTVGRNIYGSSSKTEAFTSMAQLIVATTGLGYASMAAKDLIKGREPRDYDDPNTWMKAMLQGGALGIYGDVLFGETQKQYGQNAVSVLAGPTIGGTAVDLFDLYSRAKAGDDVAAGALKTVISHTPFANHFMVKPALDYGIMYHVQEAINPGYLRRMERRIKDENGQEFFDWARPSDVAR